MSVISKLSSSLNQRDEMANKQLALQVIHAEDHDAVKQLIENLKRLKDLNPFT